MAEGEVGGDDALITGTLRLTGDCALLEQGNGQTTILVWPTGRTSWNSSRSTVSLEQRDGRTVELADGDAAGFAGSGGMFGPDGSPEAVAWPDWLATLDWTAEPDPACQAEGFWMVGEVVESTS